MEFWLTNSLRQESPAYLAEREMRERTGHPCLPRAPSSPPIRDLMIRQQQRKWKPRWKIWNLFALIPSRPVTWSMEVKLELKRGDPVRVQREIKNLSPCRSLLKLTQKFDHFTSYLIKDGGEMYKKACRLLFCSLEPIVFQTFPLPSPS